MKSVSTILFCFLAVFLFAQEHNDNKVRRIALGVKAGIPIGVGLSGEVVLPILDNRIAPYVDYSNLNDLEVDEVQVGHKYLDYGLNLYLNKKGKGLFVGIGRNSSTTDFAYEDEVSDSGNTYVGLATTSLDLNMTNLRLGFKFGGLIFGKVEVGYGIGDIPQQLNITGTTEVMGVQMTETSVEDIPSIPGWNENGMILGNLTIGVSF